MESFCSPGSLGASISSAQKYRRIRTEKKENKLFFTFHDSISKLQASTCGNISVDKYILDCACYT